MNWKDVGVVAAKAAPVLGAVLGGPVGAVAGAAGTLLASALGVEADPVTVLRKLAEQGKRFITIEHNCGQMVDDVRLAVCGLAESDFFGQMPGDIPGSDDFIAPIMSALGRK